MSKNFAESHAIKKLIELGILVSFDQTPLYHGRSNSTGEKFRVNPTHAGRGAMSTPNLSATPDLEGAKTAAQSKANEGDVIEIHRLTTLGGQYYFLNTDIRLTEEKLTKEQRREISEQIRMLDEGGYGDLNETFPISLNDQQICEEIYLELSMVINARHPFVLAEDIEDVYNYILMQNTKNKDYIKNPEKFKSHLKELIVKFSGAINAKRFLMKNPGAALYAYFQRPQKNSSYVVSGIRKDGIGFQKEYMPADLYEKFKAELGGEKIPINWEYISSWLKRNNIVGIISTRESGTAGKTLPVYFVTDLDTVKTEAEHAEFCQQIMNKYGCLLPTLKQFSDSGIVEKALADATPEQCITFINRSASHPNLATLPAGVWEGYTVGEHTEAALRLYETNYSRTLPKELQPFMRLVILLHDIGKGEGVRKRRNGERATEQEETDRVCKDMFKEFGIDEKAGQLISFIISDSQSYTTELYVLRVVDAEERLLSAIKVRYMQIFGEEPSQNVINAIASMCKILQTCDSYSYTPQAKIRRETDYGSVYLHGENAGFANNSFHDRTTMGYINPAGEQPSDPYSMPKGAPRKK